MSQKPVMTLETSTQLRVVEADHRGGVNFNEALECPRCGFDYLHHDDVVIYYRDREDAPETQVIRCAGDKVVQQRYPSHGLNNPSRRRGGLAIQFFCEGCGDGIELTIEQHKGQTLLHWRFGPSSGTPGAD
jgi:hypothetical protein